MASLLSDENGRCQGRALAGIIPSIVDIHVVNGEPGAGVIALRISMNSSRQPEISDSNITSVKDMLRERESAVFKVLKQTLTDI